MPLFYVMIIKIGPVIYDLSRMESYNPNYLNLVPPKAFITFGEAEITLTGESARQFNQCVSFYLDYKIGSKPDTNEEVLRRYSEIDSFVLN